VSLRFDEDGSIRKLSLNLMSLQEWGRFPFNIYVNEGQFEISGVLFVRENDLVNNRQRKPF
jgi:hypothetical protein